MRPMGAGGSLPPLRVYEQIKNEINKCASLQIELLLVTHRINSRLLYFPPPPFFFSKAVKDVCFSCQHLYRTNVGGL